MKKSSLWEEIAAKVLSSYAVATFAVLWIGFAVALIVNREWLAALWPWAQGLPPALRITAWVVLLPIMVGLWIWQSSWSVLGRGLGFAGILGWTLVAVYNFIKAFRKKSGGEAK